MSQQRYRLTRRTWSRRRLRGRTRAEGEAIVVNLESGTYFSLTGDSILLWNAILAGASADELAGAVAERTGESVDRIAETLHRFITSLRKQGLIVERSDETGVPVGVDLSHGGAGLLEPGSFLVYRHAGSDPARPSARGRRTRLAARTVRRLTSTASPRGGSGLLADDLRGQFALASDRAGGVIERTYRIGGKNIRLCYAGDALLERLSPVDRAPPQHRRHRRAGASRRDLGRGIDRRARRRRSRRVPKSCPRPASRPASASIAARSTRRASAR